MNFLLYFVCFASALLIYLSLILFVCSCFSVSGYKEDKTRSLTFTRNSFLLAGLIGFFLFLICKNP